MQEKTLVSSGQAEEYKVENGLYYTGDHEWVKKQSSRPSTVLVGITDYAAKMLHDIVYVQLPEIGKQLQRKDTLCQVESIKTVADVYSPVSGRVLKVNEILTKQPEKVSQSPYDEGWMVEIESTSAGEDLKSLMNASQYKDYISKIQAEE